MTAINEARNLFEAIAYFEDYRHNAFQIHSDAAGKLSTSARRAYQARGKQLAREAVTRCVLKPKDVLKFIETQCLLWENATKRSPTQLVDAYRRNIASSIELYQLLTGTKYDVVVKKIGDFGHSKPILKEVFPDWLDQQREIAEIALTNWLIPSMSGLPRHSPFRTKISRTFASGLKRTN